MNNVWEEKTYRRSSESSRSRWSRLSTLTLRWRKRRKSQQRLSGFEGQLKDSYKAEKIVTTVVLKLLPLLLNGLICSNTRMSTQKEEETTNRASTGSSRSNKSSRTSISLVSGGSSRSRGSDGSSHTTGTILTRSSISTLYSLVTLGCSGGEYTIVISDIRACERGNAGSIL